VLAGCPDKTEGFKVTGFQSLTPKSLIPRTLKLRNFELYALRRGRTVKSRTWVRMLDICIPFSCATNGSNSAIN
jgi:hypothetical protein